MRCIQGELPVQRYAGLHRSIGPQYVRGISHWAKDGSRSENVLWLVYSMNKENICVSRVPLPLKAEETRDVADDFSGFRGGAFVPGWNIYRPKWSSVEIADGALRLENRDPYDYAQATRLFPESTKVSATFTLERAGSQSGDLEIDLLSKFGGRRLVQLKIDKGGEIAVMSGRESKSVGVIRGRCEVRIDADMRRGVFSVWLDGTSVLRDAALAESGESLQRIVFRTGAFRGVGGAHPVARGTDRPIAPNSCRIFSLKVERLVSP
jgi:hypothetical protein